MSTKNDGGPAFPITAEDAKQTNIDGWGSEGMTLRDYFAAKAMQGLFASWGSHDVEDFAEIASDAYVAADAMLKARDQQEANAHLIAAAPDLLAALIECADDLEAEIKARADCELPRRIERDMGTVYRARAAIAKAKGEA